MAVRAKEVQKAVPPLVEATVATELKHLATKEGLALFSGELRAEMKTLATKDELNSQFRSLLLWTVSGFLTILIAIIAVLLIQMYQAINVASPVP